MGRLRYAVPELPDLARRRAPTLRPGHEGKGCNAVKIEGGQPMRQQCGDSSTSASRSWVTSGSRRNQLHALGGLSRQGRDDAEAGRLKADATALQDAGAFAVVLELVPAPLASQITKSLSIPDHRYRRRAGVPTAGPGAARHAWAERPVLGQIRQEVRGRWPRTCGSAARVFARRCGRALPGPEHSFGK